jgi:hypothetical protein
MLSINGDKGTQSQYLRHVDEKGEMLYTIPFTERAGLMTFDHRKPDFLDYQRDLPIVALTLDTLWTPHASISCDTTISKNSWRLVLTMNSLDSYQTTRRRTRIFLRFERLMHSECSVKIQKFSSTANLTRWGGRQRPCP